VLGGQDFIYSQASGVEDGLFKGDVLGVMADAATMDFRERAGARSLAEVDASLHVPERLLQRVAAHVARCYLGAGAVGGRAGAGSPLILGVWGPKGAGKTFSVEVAMKKMGVRVVALSAGELEDERAGEVSRRIRSRYALCQSIVAAEGEAAALVISDLDAGLGRAGAQMTVNTQNAVAELMALCDGGVPSGVRRGAAHPGARVPIVVTANDLNRTYAPLLRDGRMDKFYWEPDSDEVADVLHATVDASDVSLADVRTLVACFPGQPLDFFAAARARLPDAAVRRWLARTGVGAAGDALMAAYDVRAGCTAVDFLDGWEGGTGLPGEVSAAAWGVACGQLEEEQQRVLEENLAREYFKNHDGLGVAAGRVRTLEEEAERRRAQRRRAVEDERRWASRATDSEAPRAASPWFAMDEEERRAILDGTPEPAAAAAPEPEPEADPWRVVDAEGAKVLLDEEGYVAVDIRSRRAFRSEALKGARSCPSVDVEGFSLEAVEHDRPGWAEEFAALAKGELGDKVLILGDGGARSQERVAEAWAQGGLEGLAELRGGYPAWLKLFSPAGVRRQKGKWGTPGSEEHDYWTASN